MPPYLLLQGIWCGNFYSPNQSSEKGRTILVPAVPMTAVVVDEQNVFRFICIKIHRLWDILFS